MQPETAYRQQIAQQQWDSLQQLFQAVTADNPFWISKYAAAQVTVADIRSLDDLHKLPFCTKAELVADHAAHPPYGSNLTYPLAAYARMHQTSGTTGKPMRWLDTPASWDWLMNCWAQIYRIIGLQPDDTLCFPFSFGPFIGFWAAFEGACRLGNLCLAGGGMSSLARLRLIEENQATVVCCTPTYALRLAEVAEQQGVDLKNSSVRAILVAGEPGGGIPSTRARIEQAWGARLFDHWGMTDIGSLAIESVGNPGNLYLLETECIAEIVDPLTLEPVTPGNEGELVITNLGRLGSPVIRYRTGDRVIAETTPTPDGYELLSLKGGILGRTDDMVTIRGNNLFPSSLEAILREFAEIVEYRITIKTNRGMHHLTMELEPADSLQPAAVKELIEQVGRVIKERLNFQAEIVSVQTDALPRYEMKARRWNIE